jgi:hypothetical protein
MSKFSDAERRRIVAESHATLARPLHSAQQEERRGGEPCPPVDLPLETRNQRDRRELAERDAAWEVEREKERARAHRDQRRAELASAGADQRIAYLEQQLTDVARCAGTLCDGLNDELARVTGENAALKAKQAEVEAALKRENLELSKELGQVRLQLADLDGQLKTRNLETERKFSRLEVALGETSVKIAEARILSAKDKPPTAREIASDMFWKRVAENG